MSRTGGSKWSTSLNDEKLCPAAQANASLLRRVQDCWQNRVVPRTSMHDLLFTLVGVPYPFRRSLRVADEGEFEFRLLDHDELQKAERCGVEDDAVEILDRLLGGLTASAWLPISRLGVLCLPPAGRRAPGSGNLSRWLNSTISASQYGTRLVRCASTAKRSGSRGWSARRSTAS